MATVAIISKIIGVLQLICGLILIALGIAWVVCDLEYKPQSPDEPRWKAVVMATEIVTGVMVSVAGLLGLLSRWRWDCPGIFFVGFQVMNSVIWCPIVIISYTLLHIVIRNPDMVDKNMETYNVDRIMIANSSEEGAWLWVFPYIGIAISSLVLILGAIGSFSHCCCARKKEKSPYKWGSKSQQMGSQQDVSH